MKKIRNKFESSHPSIQCRSIFLARARKKLLRLFRNLGFAPTAEHVEQACRAELSQINRRLRYMDQGWRAWDHWKAQSAPVPPERMYEIFCEETHHLPKSFC